MITKRTQLPGNTRQSIDFVVQRLQKQPLQQQIQFTTKQELPTNKIRTVNTTVAKSDKPSSWVNDIVDTPVSFEAKPPSINVKQHFRDVMSAYGKEIRNQENRNDILNDAAEKMGDNLFVQLINAQFIDKLDTISLPCIQRFDKYIQNTMQEIVISSILDPSYALYISVNDQILLNLQKYQRDVSVYTPISTEANFIDTHKGYPLRVVPNAWTDVNDAKDWLSNKVDLVYLNAQYTGDSSMMIEVLRALFMLNVNLSSPAGSKYLCLVSPVKLPTDIQTLLRKISDEAFINFAGEVSQDDMIPAFFENKKIISGVYTGGKLSDSTPTFDISTTASQKLDIGDFKIKPKNFIEWFKKERPYIVGKDEGAQVILQVSENQTHAVGRKIITLLKPKAFKQDGVFPIVEKTIGTVTKSTNDYLFFSGISGYGKTKKSSDRFVYLDSENQEETEESEESDESGESEESGEFEGTDEAEENEEEAPVQNPKSFKRVSLDPLQMLNANIELLGMCGKLYEYLFTV